jgi:hypothetical protein
LSTALSTRELKVLKQSNAALNKIRKQEALLTGAGQLDARLLDLSPQDKIRYIRLIKERRRQRALNDFFYFSKEVYGNADLTKCHAEMAEFAVGPGKRKIMLLPRGSLKSSLYTESYVLWRLCKNPNLRVLIDNEEFSRAKAFLKAIRDCIEYNDTFRDIFGNLAAKKHTDLWTETKFNISTRTKRTKEANIECMGVDSTKTGMHYDLVVADDLVSDKNTRTDAQLKKVIEHYRLLLSLLDPGCELTIIGTRWHFADLYGYLLEGDRRREEKGERPRWRKLIRGATNKETGKLFWPERLSRDFLKEQREEQGIYMYSCQYQNDPTGGEDAIFKKEWLRFETELPEVPMECSIVLDPSLGKSKESDYSAISTRFIDPYGNRYLWRIMRGRWNPTKTLQMLVYARQWVKDRYKLEPRVGMETVAFQWVLAHNMREMQRAGKIPRFRIYELTRTTATTKHLQIERLVPLFEQGLIRLRGKSLERCSSGAKLFIQEYLQFPYGKHDDILDTVAYHEELAKIPEIPQKDREQPTIFKKLLLDAARRGRRRSSPDVGSAFGGGRRDWLSSTSTEG